MAENENKVKTENKENKGNKPPRRPHRPSHGRPRQGKPNHGGENKPQGAPSEQPKKENRPQRPDHKPAKQGERAGKPREDRRQREPRNNHQLREEKKVLSPRAVMLQERQTADQKAFAEARDILLEAEKLRGEKGAPVEDDSPKVEIVGVRFKPSGKIYYFAPKDIKFEADDGVIVETARGQEYGYVALSNRLVNVKDTVQPLKEVIRKATEADGAKNKQNRQLEEKAAKVFEELVEKHKLVMSLTDVEYTFDNSKLIFCFTAEGRVDFRDLVKDLAAVFRTRIELRQIGVRDEAKLLGGLGVCGMPFCCNRFLPDFVQVSIKMAKEQNLSLSSSKISGNCGRLMCCLRYEQDVYEQEYATFPRADMVVRTAVGTGVVAESNFINGKIKVRMDGDGTAVYKIFTRDEVKVIGKAKHRDNEAIDKELKALED